MKNKLMTRLLAVLLCAVMLFLVSCGGGAQSSESVSESVSESASESTSESVSESTSESTEEGSSTVNGSEAIVTVERNLYAPGQPAEPYNLSYYESVPDVPLLEMDQVCNDFFLSLLASFGTFTVEETDTTVTVTRENGTYCVFDFVKDTIYFDDYDKFFTKAFKPNFGDMLAGSYADAEGNSYYLQRWHSLYTPGLPVVVDLASRDIPLDIYEGKKYIPFQTFNDLFLSPFTMNFATNSQDIFLANNGTIPQEFMEIYYSVEPGDRSEELTYFTYTELCLLLDLCYGLQEEQNIIGGFSNFFAVTGLVEGFVDCNPTGFGNSLASLLMGHLADKHSNYLQASPYTGNPVPEKGEGVAVDPSILRYSQLAAMYATKRLEMMPEGVPAYQEIGNTAYVTFDSFTLDTSRVLMPYDETSTTIGDTVGLIIYAHSMITREDSPIENVVLDLSCNGGGAFDAATYVVAWMLGYCDLHIKNPITGAEATTSYLADVNLDGVFDEKDSISHLNLYCLASPVSFSCGNMVPALLKESGLVTLLGDTSGGGTCAVKFASTADGAIFQFSSPYSISVVKNGAFYSVDRGVDPHYHLNSISSYYDREALTEYINNLY